MSPDTSPATDTLTPDDWELVKDMVFSCLPLDRPARARWLDERRPPPRVRREVERLLAASQTTAAFMEVPAPQRVLETPGRSHPERIGHFRVDHVLGAGGMGVVYAAVDERLGRQVAIKVLQSDVAVDETRRKRLLWDARAASVLNHPNIVSVYEAGEADGVDYVAMELVSGTTLEDLRHTPHRDLCLFRIYNNLRASGHAGAFFRPAGKPDTDIRLLLFHKFAPVETACSLFQHGA